MSPPSHRLDPSRAHRNVSLDYLKAFLIVLVLEHHSVLAYVQFGHFDVKNYLNSSAPIVDAQRWLGFDLLVIFNDLYFMSLMFLISGVFVWSSLVRKGTRGFLRDRLLRLGLPFAIVVTLVMPLAYYPSYRMTGAEIGLLAFWWDTLRTGPWPGGPAWFVWVLLAFDIAAAGLYALAPALGTALSRAASTAARRPTLCFAALVALSAAATFPMLFVFGPFRWLTFGPFSVWAARGLHYAVYFFAGVALGAGGLGQGMFSPGGALGRRWIGWGLLGLLLYVGVLAAWTLRNAAPDALPRATWLWLYGAVFVLACAGLGLAMLALFVRFATKAHRVADLLSANAYGIYLIHYVFVVWLQYALLDAALPAIAKAALVFTGTLALSWGTIAALRRIPAVAAIV